MQIELNSIYIDKFAIAPGLTNNDLTDRTVEEMVLDQSLLKSNRQSVLKILLNWHLELNIIDLNIVMVATIGHQVLVCKPDNQPNPLQSVRKAIIAFHVDFQQACKG